MRKPLEVQISEAQQRLSQQKARLEQLERRHAQVERKRDTRRKIVAGAVVLKAAEGDPAFAALLHRILDQGVVAARDRALFDLGPGGKSDDRRESGSNVGKER